MKKLIVVLLLLAGLNQSLNAGPGQMDILNMKAEIFADSIDTMFRNLTTPEKDTKDSQSADQLIEDFKHNFLFQNFVLEQRISVSKAVLDSWFKGDQISAIAKENMLTNSNIVTFLNSLRPPRSGMADKQLKKQEVQISRSNSEALRERLASINVNDFQCFYKAIDKNLRSLKEELPTETMQKLAKNIDENFYAYFVGLKPKKHSSTSSSLELFKQQMTHTLKETLRELLSQNNRLGEV